MKRVNDSPAATTSLYLFTNIIRFLLHLNRLNQLTRESNAETVYFRPIEKVDRPVHD